MVRLALLAVALDALVASVAMAQLASQTALVGTVTDRSGSVVPGALIVAINADTQDTYETTTNTQGYYNIQFVRIGTYAITVTLDGFQTFRATGIEVAVNQVVRTDAVLRVGNVVETVTIEAAAAVLATDRATISESISETAIAELPVSGRNVWALAGTTPGVLGGTQRFVGAGQRAIQNSLSMDGISTMSNLLPATSMRPIADATTEVEVQTGTTSAEYGAYLGVHVNVVTKSGTNDLEGSVFHYLQDSALDARGYFEDPDSPANPRQRNQFGIVAGGPVMFPGLYDGHDRTFFMAAFEGVREDAQETDFVSVPTERMRQGDFSEINRTIRNPFTGAPYPGNVIPQSEVSPVALRLLQYYPLPNEPGTGANLRGSSLETLDQNQILARVDQNLGNRARLTVRYSWQDEDEVESPAIVINGGSSPRTNKNVLVGYTHTLTPSLLNDFRIGFQSMANPDLNYFHTQGLLSAGSELGIPGFDGDVRYSNPGIPNFSVSGFSDLGPGGTNWFNDSTTFQVSNVTSLSHGSHNLRAGIDMRRLYYARLAANEPRGSFTFNGQMTGYSVADLLLGVPQRVTTPVNQLEGNVAGWRNGFFVNDTWQATRDLTLSLGLRYEMNTPVHTTSGYASMLNADQTALIPTSHPAPGFQFHEPNRTDFAPRVGLNYRLTEKTVVRAGWGIYYNPNQMNTFTFLTNNPPLAPEFLFTSEPGNPTLTFDSPTGEIGPAAAPNVTTPNRHLPDARKNQWSLDVQREFWPGTVIDLQYVGSRTTNLDQSFMNNTPMPGPGPVQDRRPNPAWGVIRTIQNDLSADYDALSLILRRRMRGGWQLNAHYTWSRTRDMGSHSNSSGSSRPGVNPYTVYTDNYGRSDWDVPHRVVASYLYELPFFQTSGQPFLKHVLAGWQVSGITTIESGRPMNVTISGDVANTGIERQRPDLVGPASANCGQDHLTGCIDAAAFATPAPYTYGNAPRNVLRGPGSVVTDLSLAKSFPIGAQATLQLRADFFNVFNRVNLNNPNTAFGTANFGRITSAQSMRQIQLGAKVLF